MAAVNELVDLETHEVSLVDNPAIRRKFLVIKRSGIDKEQSDMPRNVQPASEGNGVVTDPVPAQEIKKVVVGDVLSISTFALERLSGVKASAETNAQAPMQMGDLDAVKEVVDELAQINKVSEGTMVNLVMAVERLLEFVSALRDMDPAKELDKPMLDELVAISAILSGVLVQYPNPESNPQQATETSEMEADQVEQSEQPAEELKKSDVDNESLEQFVLASVACGLEFERMVGEDQDPTYVVKAGAKMRQARLSAFKNAVDSLSSAMQALQKILGEIDPQDHIEKCDPLADLRSEFERQLTEVREEIKKIAQVVPAGSVQDPPSIKIKKFDDSSFHDIFFGSR